LIGFPAGGAPPALSRASRSLEPLSQRSEGIGPLGLGHRDRLLPVQIAPRSVRRERRNGAHLRCGV